MKAGFELKAPISYAEVDCVFVHITERLAMLVRFITPQCDFYSNCLLRPAA